MGYIYFKLNQRKKAFIAYEKALKYDPEDIDTWIEYANVLEGIELQKAMRSYGKALELMKKKAKLREANPASPSALGADSEAEYKVQPEIYVNIGVL